MTMRLQGLKPVLLFALAGLALGGCSESQRPEASGKGTVRGIHAIPTAADIGFLIEERSLGNLSYKGATSPQQYDNLTYTFNFDARVPGSSSLSRIASETVTIVEGMEYVFAVTGTVASPSILLWENELRQWEGSETVFEVSVGHLAAGTGPVDVFFAPTGTDPIAGSERGTLSFGDRLPPFETESGTYRLIITEQGNPAAVLFTASSREYDERTSQLFTLQDADPSITSPLSVRRIDQSGTSTEVGDPGFPPTRRFFNAGLGSGNIDVYVGDDFDTPIVSDLAFGVVSADVPVPAGQRDYTYTAAGNPGAILAEDEDTVAANTRGTNFITGEPDDLAATVFIDDRRPVTGFAKVRVNQVAAGPDNVDVYLLRDEIDIADSAPNLPRLGSGVTSGYLHLSPGSYELTVTETGEKNVLAGPVALTIAAGDIVETAILDTADPNVLEVVVY